MNNATHLTNAEKYIEPVSIMHTIVQTVPERCPLYVITGMGLTQRCEHGDCKKCTKEWLRKKETK
jgi:hypothetical protein